MVCQLLANNSEGVGRRDWGLGRVFKPFDPPHAPLKKGGESTQSREHVRFASGRPALIPQPLFPKGQEEQDFKVPLPVGEGFRVRADKGDMLPSQSPCLARSFGEALATPLHSSAF